MITLITSSGFNLCNLIFNLRNHRLLGFFNNPYFSKIKELMQPCTFGRSLSLYLFCQLAFLSNNPQTDKLVIKNKVLTSDRQKAKDISTKGAGLTIYLIEGKI